MYLIVFGGRNNKEVFSDVFVFSTMSHQWIKIPVKGNAPLARYNHSMTLFASQYILFGGIDGNGKCLNEIHCLDGEMIQIRENHTHHDLS